MKYLAILLMLASMPVQAEYYQEKYNHYEGRYESVPADYVLKFDPYNKEWSYAPLASERKYNPIEGRHEITRPDSEIEYDTDYFEFMHKE